MSINFKKLNSQIKPLKPEARHVGYIFIATDKQKRESLVDSIAKPGSKRSLIKVLTYFIKTDEKLSCRVFTLIRNPMLTIDFPDKSVTYDTFVRDVASSVVRMLADTHNDPEMVSQRKAYAMFGRGNVDRWRKQGKITPCKRPGKVEYRTIELRTLQRLQQDYFK